MIASLRASSLYGLFAMAACAPTGAASAPPPVVATSAAAPLPAPIPAPVREESPRATPAARLRLGHYSSRDGLFGLVLDRTSSPPRARIDGKNEIVELAVKPVDDDELYLVSADEALYLHIGGWGGLELVRDQGTPVGLMRDGAGEALAVPALRAPDPAAASANASKACGTPIRFEMAATVALPAPRGTNHLLTRIALALAGVCRDDAGRAAVKQKLRVVRVGAANATHLTLDGGTLTVQANLEDATFGPFKNDIETFVAKKL